MIEPVGYSERGMLNALFYESCLSKDESFIRYLFRKLYDVEIGKDEKIEVFFEISLSDFGDPDIVIKIGKKLMFIEGKVSTGSTWKLSKHIDNFQKGLKETVSGFTSNIFTQLLVDFNFFYIICICILHGFYIFYTYFYIYIQYFFL